MSFCVITVFPQNRKLTVPVGTNLLSALRQAGLHADAPCGGHGTCGKCKVLIDGQAVLACQTTVDRDMTVALPEVGEAVILTSGLSVATHPDGENAYALAFDIGTTSVVCYLLDGHTGNLIAQASCLNPQTRFGGDVISRLQHVLQNNSDALQASIREALADLTIETAQAAGISPEAITVAAIAGNTAMHHLLLGIDPKPLTTPPYMPAVSEAMELPAHKLLPISPTGTVRMLPNIAGFVGGDTAGCLTAVRFDRMDKLTLMLDIGTNGEMVLGDKHGFLACSSAAGPAFEGAKISCGMRGAAGAVDHVYLENGQVRYHVIDDAPPMGLCGSGLLDLTAVLLETEEITGTGRMPCKEYPLGDSSVVLTQQDVRELQLAKGAIRAGIELMCEHLGRRVEEIDTVLLAGAFGNYLNPASACRIGMIPPCLESKIRPIGNAAGVGAQLCALSRAEFDYTKDLAAKAQFLELASLPQFQDRFVDALSLEEDEDD